MTLEEASEFLTAAGFFPHLHKWDTGYQLHVGAIRIEHSSELRTYEYMIWIEEHQSQWMVLDMQYIDKWSLWLDLRIVLQTAAANLRKATAATSCGPRTPRTAGAS